MLTNIYLPSKYKDTTCVVSRVHVKLGVRIRRDQVLFSLLVNNKRESFISPYDGWVRFVAVTQSQSLVTGDLLLIVDAVDIVDYRLDETEVNLQTELGQEGRRGLEREGQRAFVEAYADRLFDAPQTDSGQARQGVKEHPFLMHMKEGVPPKMSDARHNQPAQDRVAEQASHDPELRLSPKLQAQLGLGSAPSSAPSLTRG